jgi:hypothetical protein
MPAARPRPRHRGGGVSPPCPAPQLITVPNTNLQSALASAKATHRAANMVEDLSLVPTFPQGNGRVALRLCQVHAAGPSLTWACSSKEQVLSAVLLQTGWTSPSVLAPAAHNMLPDLDVPHCSALAAEHFGPAGALEFP